MENRESPTPQEAIQPQSPENQTNLNSEQLEALPPRQKIGHFLEGAIKLSQNRLDEIKQKITPDSPPSDEDQQTKTLLEEAIDYDAKKGIEGCSPAVKALLSPNILRTDDEGEDYLREQLTPFVKIQTNDQEYSYEDWKIKKSDMSPEEANKAEAAAIYKFAVPEEEPQPTPSEQAKKIIQQEIKNLEQKKDELPEEGEERKAFETKLAQLKIAEKADGELGPLLKKSALEQLQAGGVENLEDPITDITPEAETAKEKLTQILESSGLDQEKINQMKEIAKEPDGLFNLLSSEDFNNIPDITKNIYGETTDMSDKEVDDLADKILTPEQKAKLGGNLKKGLLILLILGLIPVAIGVAGAAITLDSAKQLASSK